MQCGCCGAIAPSWLPLLAHIKPRLHYSLIYRVLDNSTLYRSLPFTSNAAFGRDFARLLGTSCVGDRICIHLQVQGGLAAPSTLYRELSSYSKIDNQFQLVQFGPDPCRQSNLTVTHLSRTSGNIRSYSRCGQSIPGLL